MATRCVRLRAEQCARTRAVKLSEVTDPSLAMCAETDCGWTHVAIASARNAAIAHVLATGHRVRLIIETTVTWGPA